MSRLSVRKAAAHDAGPTGDDRKRKQHAAAAPEKLAFTIQEAVLVSSLGQTSLYKAIKDGQLTARKYGTRTIITRADLTTFLANLPPTSPA
ncbi:helix-turn-helix domain-containing protein [Bradyrhizobium cenepequi]|uniref:helix-turn-helix domain-containing protein n=1 Tax=Bradyrhizobium cenepequi TaxID=2821403 RepID=UPI001CE3794C|nr:helix-turn-helix domain-containing protein [Bradyrhizobium cenepequi]